MCNKSIKLIVTLLLALILVTTMMQPTFAAKAKATEGWDSVKIKPKDTTGTSESVGNLANAILSVVQVVAMGTAVIMLIVLGIKYISAAPSDKAEIKKHAVVYVVGAVVLFGATGIIGIIRKFAVNIG